MHAGRRNHMTTATRKSMLRTVLAMGLVLVATVQATRADQDGAGRLAGTWEITLTLVSCQDGTPLGLPPVYELATFTRGGTMISSTSGVPPAAKTPGHGVWSHVSGQAYAYGFKFLRFTSNTFSGWAVVRQVAELNSNADGYSAQGGVEFYDAAGTRTGAGCSTTVATRMQ
jgi:hypothetical protein